MVRSLLANKKVIVQGQDRGVNNPAKKTAGGHSAPEVRHKTENAIGPVAAPATIVDTIGKGFQRATGPHVRHGQQIELLTSVWAAVRFPSPNRPPVSCHRPATARTKPMIAARVFPPSTWQHTGIPTPGRNSRICTRAPRA
jgi:hypothetical protein